MEFAEDRPLLHIGELSRRLGGQRPCAPGLGESLRPAAAGALARRLPAVLRGGPVADPPDAGLSRRWAVRGRGGTRRAQQRREYPSRPARRASPRRACGERAVRRVPAGSGRFRRAGRAGPCRTGCSPICPCRPSCGMSCCPTSLTSASAGSARQPAWPWSIRQQSHPRPARGADPWLGEQARPAGPARLPPGAARYGADGFRHLYSTATAGGSAISERASRSRSWSGPPAPRVLTPTASSPASSPGTGTSSTR
jgi:hypothetical protein